MASKEFLIQALNFRNNFFLCLQVHYAASDANQGIRLLLSFVADLSSRTIGEGSFEKITNAAVKDSCFTFVGRKYNGRHVGRPQQGMKYHIKYMY